MMTVKTPSSKTFTCTGMSALRMAASTVPLPCCLVPTTVWDSTIRAEEVRYKYKSKMADTDLRSP